MPDSLGYSFLPGVDQPSQPGMGGAPPIGRNEALQILSLILPKQGAPHGIAPPSLLTGGGTGGGADPGVALIGTILGKLGLLGPGAAPAAPGGPGGPESPFAPPPTGGPMLPVTPPTTSPIIQPVNPMPPGGGGGGGGIVTRPPMTRPTLPEASFPFTRPRAGQL